MSRRANQPHDPMRARVGDRTTGSMTRSTRDNMQAAITGLRLVHTADRTDRPTPGRPRGISSLSRNVWSDGLPIRGLASAEDRGSKTFAPAGNRPCTSAPSTQAVAGSPGRCRPPHVGAAERSPGPAKPPGSAPTGCLFQASGPLAIFAKRSDRLRRSDGRGHFSHCCPKNHRNSAPVNWRPVWWQPASNCHHCFLRPGCASCRRPS